MRERTLPAPLAVAWEPLPIRTPPWAQGAALAGLGIFSTATAAVVYLRLIASAGPAFTAQLNYLISL